MNQTEVLILLFLSRALEPQACPGSQASNETDGYFR
jgi:hypothetical protein